MAFLNKITGYVIITAIILVILTGIVIVVVFIVRRNGAKKLTKDTSYYRNYSMEDTMEFIPIEDIVRDDMIIVRGAKPIFIAVLKTRGSDIYKESIEEVVRVKNNYTAFLHALTAPITYRQYGVDINMAHTMKRYKRAYDMRLNETYKMTEEYKAAKLEFESIRGTGDSNESEMASYLLKLQKKIEAYNWRILHLENQMEYIGRVSGPAADSQQLVKTYVLEWEDTNGVMGVPLSDSELRKKAAVELEKLCRSKISQLGSANTTAIRCTTAELIDMCRTLCKPVSGNRFTMRDIQDTSYGEDIVSTGKVNKLDEELELGLIARFMAGQEQEVAK